MLGAANAGVLACMPLGTLTAGALVDGIGLPATLLAFGASYALLTQCPLAFGIWRQVERSAAPAVRGTNRTGGLLSRRSA